MILFGSIISNLQLIFVFSQYFSGLSLKFSLNFSYACVMNCYSISNRCIYFLCSSFFSILIVIYFKGFEYPGDFSPVVTWSFDHNSMDCLLVY